MGGCSRSVHATRRIPLAFRKREIPLTLAIQSSTQRKYHDLPGISRSHNCRCGDVAQETDVSYTRFSLGKTRTQEPCHTNLTRQTLSTVDLVDQINHKPDRS